MHVLWCLVHERLVQEVLMANAGHLQTVFLVTTMQVRSSNLNQAMAANPQLHSIEMCFASWLEHSALTCRHGHPDAMRR